MQECRWKIGDEKSVRIWKNQWILAVNGRILPRPPIGQHTAAEDHQELILIDRSWDLQQLNNLFSPQVIAEILKLKPSPTEHKDSWLWTAEKSSSFSVKSAYRMLVKGKENQRGESSNTQSQNSFWKKIWNMRIPKKLKYLLGGYAVTIYLLSKIYKRKKLRLRPIVFSVIKLRITSYTL